MDALGSVVTPGQHGVLAEKWPEGMKSTASGREMHVPLSDTETGMLMNMFTGMSKLPAYMDVDVHHKHERLRAWRVALETRFAATRPVVLQWFSWCWSIAEQHYAKWLRTHILQRADIQIETSVPVRFEWIDNHFQQRIYDALPHKIQTVVRQESLCGLRKRVVDMLYMLFQFAGPGTLDETDFILRRLRSPNPCKDPASALAELRSWWSSMTRATELGIVLPDVQELFRGAVSIYEAVFADHLDPSVQFRWQS